MNLLEQEKSELEENLAQHLDINGVYDALNYIVKRITSAMHSHCRNDCAVSVSLRHKVDI